MIRVTRIPLALSLITFLLLGGFYLWGYHDGASSPCNEVKATDIFKVEPK